MSTLKIAVLYDRVWEEDSADAGPQDKSPVTRTLTNASLLLASTFQNGGRF